MKKKQNPKKEVHQLILGKQRTQQVEQGYFDGRFVQRAEPSKKIYRGENNKRWGEEWRGGDWWTLNQRIRDLFCVRQIIYWYYIYFTIKYIKKA